VGTTRRQGLELSLSQDADAFDWRLAYSLLDATFRHGACLLSESNSSAGSSEACPGEGEIAVRPGDRMAGLPRHSLKLTANAHLRPGWTVGAQFSAYSSQRVQGNENGGQRPDGVDYFGSGHVGGYALLDLTTNIALGHGVEVFAKVANVFDRRYATGGSLAQNPSTPTASCCRRTSGATRSSPPRGRARCGWACAGASTRWPLTRRGPPAGRALSPSGPTQPPAAPAPSGRAQRFGLVHRRIGLADQAVERAVRAPAARPPQAGGQLQHPAIGQQSAAG
jgi:hypothetical protein